MDIKEKQETLIDSYKIFNTPEGKLILKDLEKYCNFDRTTKDLNSNLDEMAIKEGKRMVFLHIKKKIEKSNLNFYELII